MTVTELPTPVPTKTFSAQTLTNELGRRKKNKVRARTGEERTRAASWVLPGMSKQQINDVLAGGTAVVEFKNRTEIVGLAS